MFRSEARFDHIPGYGGLDYRLEIVADRHGTPRGYAWQGKAGRDGSVPVILFRHGESYGEEPLRRCVAQVRGAVLRVNPRFAHQRPAVIADAEQAGEGESAPVLRAGRERGVRDVLLFIARLSALPPDHRVALGSEEDGGLLREVEARRLPLDDDASGIAVARHLVAEGKVIVTHAEDHVERLLPGVLERDRQLVRAVLHFRALDAVHPVDLLYRPGLLTGVGHPPAEVARVRYESQRRLLQNGLSPVGYRIGRDPRLNRYVHSQLAVGTGNACLLSPHGR